MPQRISPGLTNTQLAEQFVKQLKEVVVVCGSSSRAEIELPDLYGRVNDGVGLLQRVPVDVMGHTETRLSLVAAFTDHPVVKLAIGRANADPELKGWQVCVEYPERSEQERSALDKGR